MPDQNQNEYLTIILTNRRPVKIIEKDWHVLAESTDKECDTEIEVQADRLSKWDLKVRQHKYGRVLVYGSYSYKTYLTHHPNERNLHVCGGELLDSPVDIPAAVRRVGEWMAQRKHHNKGAARRWEELINNCIANIPAEEI